MGKDTDFQIQEAQRIHNKIYKSRYTPRHAIKMTKHSDKEKKLKSSKTKEDSFIREKSHKAIRRLFSRN